MTADSPTPTRPSFDSSESCSLPPAGLEARLAWIRSEILPHAVSHEPMVDGVVWELEDAPGLATRLDQLIALEDECCPGLTFDHGPGSSASRRRFAVHGIDPRASVFNELETAGSPPAKLGLQLARSAGIGTAVSLIVCCVLPIGAAAVVGGGTAAALGSLDQPWIIASSALLFGATALGWQRRRGRPMNSAGRRR